MAKFANHRARIDVCHGPLSEDDQTKSNTSLKLQLADDSYKGPGVLGLESSQASLNKRLASAAGLEEDGPTDFNFLFEGEPDHAARQFDDSIRDGVTPSAPPVLTPPKRRVVRRRSSDLVQTVEKSTDDPDACPPLIVVEGDLQWVRTDITRGADLVDGQAWIAEFEERLASAKACADAARKSERSTRQVGHADRDIPLRNKVLRELVKTCPPGRKVRLETGQTVIFWFNIGPPGPPRKRVYVTDAVCPHQGVCLLGSELFEIEDLVGVPRAATRCPRHNKTFDLCTGDSVGNVETLKTYPCRFDRGRWYVGVERNMLAEATSTVESLAELRPATLSFPRPLFLAADGSASFVAPTCTTPVPLTEDMAPEACASSSEKVLRAKGTLARSVALRKRQRIGYESEEQ